MSNSVTVRRAPNAPDHALVDSVQFRRIDDPVLQDHALERRQQRDVTGTVHAPAFSAARIYRAYAPIDSRAADRVWTGCQPRSTSATVTISPKDHEMPKSA